MLQFIILFLIGIIIFYYLNNKDTFSIGVPWIIVDRSLADDTTIQLSGEPFLCDTDANGDFRDGHITETCFKKYSDVVRKIDDIDPTALPNIVPDIYHIVRDVEKDHYRTDLEYMCKNPHKKISGTHLSQSTGVNSEWKQKTKQNYETKPLLPRKNLKITSDGRNYSNVEDLTEVKYNSLDTISYACDTEKTQSKPVYNLLCKPRKKFVLRAHGTIMTNYKKTTIPQLFQLKLYKSHNNQCIHNNFYGQSLQYESIIRGTDVMDLYNGKNIKSNKKYLAVLDMTQPPENMPLEELVYSELSKLNSGRLYLGSRKDHEHYTTKSDRLYFTNGDHMYFFSTDGAASLVVEERLEANMISFLNPFMSKSCCILHDNGDTTPLDIIQLKTGNPEFRSSTRFPGTFPSEIYPNGTIPNNLIIHEVGEPTEFNSPHTQAAQWNISQLPEIPQYAQIPQMNDELIRLCQLASNRQNEKYPSVSEAVPGQPYTAVQIFRDAQGNAKPVYLYTLRVIFDPRLVLYLKTQVKALLQSCCVTIDPSLLRPGFQAQASFQRLFPLGISRDFPLLFFDLYVNDGFVHLNNESALDDQNGEYTSSDLRELANEIIYQIYDGVDLDYRKGPNPSADTIQTLTEYGYYQMFKTKMMLEKGLNDREGIEILFNLYGNTVVSDRKTFLNGPLKYSIKNKYLCVRLLEAVWGEYGYDYEIENLDMYSYSADLPIILAKLFKTEIGESADVHLLCCIKREDTNVRSIQKNGYWKCKDDETWTDGNGNGCDFYNQESLGKTSIQKCKDWGQHGANDHCCMCMMVKNIDENENENGKPNIGPKCKVKECQQTLDVMNADLSNDDMGITPDDWTTTNTWPEYPNPPGRTEGPMGIGDNLPRKMEHVETAYRYESDVTNPDYGSVQLITDPSDNIDGVLRETEPIQVLCENPSGYPAFAATVAGNIKCIDPLVGDSDEARYRGDLDCPTELPQINMDYFAMTDAQIADERHRFACSSAMTSSW